MKIKSRLFMLTILTMAALQTACVEPGHNYKSDGLPLGGTVWRAENIIGSFKEISTIEFEVGTRMKRTYQTFEYGILRLTDEAVGTYKYVSPEGHYTINNVKLGILVNGKNMTVESYPLTYYCIKGRD